MEVQQFIQEGYFKPNVNYTIEQIRKDNESLNSLTDKQLAKILDNFVKNKILIFEDNVYRLYQKELVICEVRNNKIYTRESNKKLFAINDISKYVNGDIVVTQMEKKDTCKVIERIGHIDDPDIDLMIIATSKAIKLKFNKSSLNQLETIPTKITEEEIKNRYDLRDKLIYTIDGADTKDMDDAISVGKNEKGNYILGVHIADVSYYVKKDTPLYNEALERGNSVYMIDKVIPMLPHQLSNGICSLNEGEDRLTMSCIMEINANGDIIDSKIVESVINSKKKMTYEDVDKILMEGIIPEGYEDFVDNLKLCNELSFILNKNYQKSGYLHFKDNSVKIITDENGFPIKFEPLKVKAGRKIIENFMLAANKTVAETYEYQPFYFRIHEEPEKEDLEEVLKTLYDSGYEIPYHNVDQYKLNKIFKQIYDQGNYSVISPQLLAIMRKATYSSHNIGHFGLGFEAYTHFTSPIRRFNDLEVHRLIKEYKDPNITDRKFLKNESEIPAICDHINEKEIAANEAEMEAVKLKMAEYMKEHEEEYFNGKVISIGPKFVNVRLENGIVGKVELKDIKNDLYYFDKNTHSIKGMRTNTEIGLADYVRIKVMHVSTRKRSINFKITEKLNVEDKQTEKSNGNGKQLVKELKPLATY